MALVRLLEFMLFISFGYFLLSQIVLPVFKGDPILPVLWTKENQLQSEKHKLEQLLREQHTSEEVEELRRKLYHETKFGKQWESNSADPVKEK